MQLDLNKLAAAKLWLISPPTQLTASGKPSADAPRDLPYLSVSLYALIPIASEDVERMTCDEFWRVYVNPLWLAAASIPAVGSELAHIVWHLLADHTARARDAGVDKANAKAWHTCADATISHTLAPDRLRPPYLTTPADLHLPGGWSVEQYFAVKDRLSVVPDSSDDPSDDPTDASVGGCGSGADGIQRSFEIGPDTDVGAVTKIDAMAIRERVAIDFRDGAKGIGTVPGDLQRWIDTVLEPKVAWEPLLSGAVRRAVGWAAGRGDYTYQRPSRRASSLRNVVLPGQHRPVPRLSLIVDTSYSMDDELLARALAEVDGAIGALGLPGSHVSLYSVDAAANLTTKVRRARDAVLIGAGGTDLRVGLKAIEEERPRPDVVIVFTDGGTPWPASPPPGAAVIIAVLEHEIYRDLVPKTPSWATRVDCFID